MDPFAALSLVCNVFDLAERAYKTGRIIKDIYDNANGQKESHAQLECRVADMEQIRVDLRNGSAQLCQTHLDQHFEEAFKRSHEATEALRLILDECRARKPGSLRHSTMAAFRSRFRGSIIQQQLDILQECRSKLQMLIVTNTNQQVGRIVEILQNTGADLQSMRINLQEVHGRFKQQASGSNLVLNFDKLKTMTKEAVLRFNANRILRGLDVQHARYDEVVDASPFTYRWIYDEQHGQPGPSHESAMPPVMVQAKDNIQSWLSTGAGILHIAGKPGAGKSTLMKFIVKNKHTTTLLRRWAGTKPLVVVKFFFWKPGNWHQNTLQGLKRSIVAQVLKAAPELSQDIFPHIYQDGFSIDLLESPSVDHEEVRTAFDRLLGSQRTKILDPYMLCLFLDGLDEFEEAAENINHSDLISLIIGWVEASDGRVKACVSSRQLPAFNGIAATHRIKLQDITFGDITDHIDGSLKEDKSFQQLQAEDPNGCEEMIKELAQRADGVFLWVALVIKSVQRGLSNLDPLTKLRAIIKETPKGLDQLINRILCEITQGPYRKEVHILLAIALKRIPEEVMEFDDEVIGLAAECSFISLFAAGYLFTALDSGLELRQIFQKVIANPPHCEEHSDDGALDINKALVIAATQVSGRCLGLLEVVNDPYAGTAVEFLHRSIPEYLEKHVSIQLEELGINSVDVINVMACMVSTDVYYYFRDSCYKFDILSPRFIFLTRWAKLETIRRQERLDDTTLQLLGTIDRRIVASALFQAYLHDESDELAVRDPLPTILRNACYVGLSQYVEWALSDNRAEYLTRLYQHLLLRHACTGAIKGESGCSEVIGMLMKRGFASRCTEITIRGGIEAFDTLWLSLFGFVINAFDSSISNRSTAPIPSPSVVWPSIEAFLNHHSARPACLITWNPPKYETEREKVRCWLRSDGNSGFIRLENWFSLRLIESMEPIYATNVCLQARLSTEVKSFLADLLEKAEKAPGFKRRRFVSIRFDDLMNRFYSKEIGWSSLHLREKEPASKTPEAPRSPPIHGGGFSPYVVLLSIVVVVGALVFARLLYSNRNAVSPEDI